MLSNLMSAWSGSTTDEDDDEARALDRFEDEEEADDKRRSLLSDHEHLQALMQQRADSRSDHSLSEPDEEFELLVAAYMHDAHYTSRPQAVNNLCYATLNAGLVALPYAAYQAGLPLFITMVILLGVASGYTTCMVVAMAEDSAYKAAGEDASYLQQSQLLSYSRLGPAGMGRPVPRSVRTLEDLVELAFGVRGYYFVSLFQVFLSLVLMSLSLQIWAEIMQSVLSSRLAPVSWLASDKLPALDFLLTTRPGAVLIGGAVVLPFILRSASLSSLRWTAYATVLVVACGLLSVVYAFTVDRLDAAPDTPIVFSDIGTPKSQWWAVSFVTTLCFSVNQKAFSVYSCLRRRSSARWQFAVRRSSGLMAFLYLVFGVFGYLSHVEEGDRLNRFNYYLDFDSSSSQSASSSGSVFFDVTRCIVATSLLLTIPVDSLVAATTLRRLLHRAKLGAALRRFKRNVRQRLAACSSYVSKCCQADPLSESSSHSRSDADVKQAAAAVNASLPTPNSGSPPVPLSPPRAVFGESISNSNSSRSHASRTDASDSASDATLERQNSVGDVMDRLYVKSDYSCCSLPEHALPALFFWGASVAFCCLIDNWLLLAATFGSVSTSLLVLVLPSMLYFRLGLSSDYRAAPLVLPLLGSSQGLLRGGALIPNRAYMLAIQALGVALLLGNMGCVFYVVFFSQGPQQ